ncbi:MAG: ferredoxin [Nanoarchaeota archaeon]|nr:ferredoxin [Nanoarchaeota archaeon]
MAKVKITQDVDECIGCGACTAMCNKYWEIDSDSKSHIKKGRKLPKNKEELEVPESDLKCNIDAAEACPVNCIHVFVDGQKKV